MFRLLRWSVRGGTRRSIVGHIVMNMAATGAAITIVTDSIAFPVNVGTVGSAGQVLQGHAVGLVPNATEAVALPEVPSPRAAWLRD